MKNNYAHSNQSEAYAKALAIVEEARKLMISEGKKLGLRLVDESTSR